jgi:hypothetical protein
MLALAADRKNAGVVANDLEITGFRRDCCLPDASG